MLAARFRKARVVGNQIGPNSDAADLHRLRIQGKRFRYALEFLADLYPGETRQLVKRMAELQDILGRHQDAHLAAVRLRRLAAKHGDELEPATIFAMGEIAERYMQSLARIRDEFPLAYERVKKAWKSLRKVLAEQLAARPQEKATADAG